MAREPIAIFWDLDGTLLSTGGAGWPCMLKAADRQQTGLFQSFSGLTDFQILAKLTGSFRKDDLEAKVDVYLNCLDDSLSPGLVKTIPSALDAFETLSGRGFRNFIATGNHPTGAQIKLRSAGLDQIAESVPIFGSSVECPDRASIVRTALRHISVEKIILVGDSLNDVETAIDVGAFCIAVETGHHSRTELERAGATRVLPREYRGAELVAAVTDLASFQSH